MAIVVNSPYRYEEDWAGYMHVVIDAMFQITLNDARDNLHVHISKWDTSVQGSSKSGYGYINIVMLGWMFPATSMRFANEVGDPEAWSKAIGEVQSACPTYQDYLIWGCGMSDEGTPPAVEQYLRGSFDHDFPLTDDDWVDGKLRDFQIANSISRWRDNAANQSVVTVSNEFNLSLSDLAWPYYPNAVMQGGRFVSCNSDGNDFMRYDGGWQPCQNDMYDEGSSKFQYHNGSGWVATPLIGA